MMYVALGSSKHDTCGMFARIRDTYGHGVGHDTGYGMLVDTVSDTTPDTGCLWIRCRIRHGIREYFFMHCLGCVVCFTLIYANFADKIPLRRVGCKIPGF